MTALEDIRPRVSAVLVVEDASTARKALACLLRQNGFTTVAAASAEEALRMVSRGACPDIAVVDFDLPGMNGLDFIALLRKVDSNVHAVLLTAADEDRVWTTKNDRTIPYMQKPVNFQHLLTLIREQANEIN